MFVCHILSSFDRIEIFPFVFSQTPTGRSHNSSFHLFRKNQKASEGLKNFAETGTSAVLDELSQGEGGIYDEFNAPLIPHGIGRTEAEFFVDGNHSRVSFMY